MKFEVGKKYKRKNWDSPVLCKFVADEVVVMQSERTGVHYSFEHEEMTDGLFQEIREPREWVLERIGRNSFWISEGNDSICRGKIRVREVLE